MNEYDKADLVIKGASFFCGKDLDNDADFIAIKGNRILSTGREPESCKYIGKDTRVKTYTKDNLIMPGFYDSHTHIISAGMADKYPTLDHVKRRMKQQEPQRRLRIQSPMRNGFSDSTGITFTGARRSCRQ